MTENFQPKVVQTQPYQVKLEKGKTYYWCACGLSKKDPFCDGSHKGTGVGCITFVAEADEEVFLCGCKQTQTKPLCDGSHNGLL